MRPHYLISALLLAALGCTPTAPPQEPERITVQPLAPPPGETAKLPQIAPDPREPYLAAGLTQLLSREHLVSRPIDDNVSREAFGNYLESLDPGKLFLLASHVELLQPYADRMDDQLRAGDLELARKGAAMLAQRNTAVAALVADILRQPFDFSAGETYETDADKRTFCADEAALRDRWRRLLKLQALERIAQMEEEAKEEKDGKKDGEEKPKSDKPVPKTFAEQEKAAREAMARSYAARFKRQEDTEPLDPASTFLNAVASVYDPHTNYLAPAEKENFDIAMSGSLQGIGALLGEKEHYIEVRELVPGGASSRQGKLAAGDLILAVAQKGEEAVDVMDMPINRVVGMIRGPSGTVVVLTVKKPDGDIQDIAITRDRIEIEAAYARGAIIEASSKKKYGYIHLPSFYGPPADRPGNDRNATGDVNALLEGFEKQKLPGVIVDLRGNGGGLLEHARAISGLFIERGPVVQTRMSSGELEVLTDPDPRVAYNGEVVVMVDRGSASASEILAGALQDYGRALIVGTGATHGKGTVQALLNLDRMRPVGIGEPLGTVKITIQQFYRVNGDSTQWQGVVPDVVLPDPIAHVETGERFLDHAIAAGHIDPLNFQRWRQPKWQLPLLVKASAERVAANDVFAKIKARSAYLESRREETLVPLSLDAWQARRARDEKALEQADPKLEDGPVRQQAKLVDYAHKAGSGSNDTLDKWIEGVERDPWLTEALSVLDDMLAAP